MPPLASTSSAGVSVNTSVQVPAAAQISSYVSRSGSMNTAQRRRVAERWHAADRKAGRRAHGVGIDPRARRSARGRGQLRLVELIRPAHVGEHDLAVDGEDQALHDLADVAADRRGRIGCGLRAVRELHGLDVDPERTPRLDDAHDVAMGWCGG